MQYRSEVDGLRALAVLPVILFHAGFPIFSGGFVGVDVFFVISGYLITSILIEDLERGSFNLLNFYERRARRILPALFLIVFVSIPFAWFFMPQSQLKDFSNSLIAVSFFVSNFLFWRESGYFDTIVDEKPLLHTWSLAVEEQFYIVFPVLLFFLWGFGKKRAIWVISILAFISLVLSEWGSANAKIANFYLAPFRAWELFLGSIAAFIISKTGIKKNNLLSFCGIAAIIFSIFYFDKNTPFPSSYTLIPVLGTFLIILFGTKETLVAKLLSNRAIVGIGLISYSAYLWHQPIFAFARIKFDQELSNVMMLNLSLMSLVLAYFTWRFVEMPFRSKNERLNQKKIFLYSFFAAALTVMIGIIGSATDFHQKLTLSSYEDEDATDFAKVLQATQNDLSLEMSSSDCHIWVKNSSVLDLEKLSNCEKKFSQALVILGDSHAMNLHNIVSYSESYPFIISIADGGCRPYRNYNDKKCHYLNFENFMRDHKDLVSLVAFHQSGSYFIIDQGGYVDSDAAFSGRFAGFDIKGIRYVKDYLEYINKNYGVTSIWVGPFLEYRRSPENLLSSKENYNVNVNSVNLFKALNILISEIVNDSKFTRHFPFERFFFQPEKAIIGECFVFRDKDHYSRCGEKIIGRKSFGIKHFEGAIIKKPMPSIYLDIDKYYHPKN